MVPADSCRAPLGCLRISTEKEYPEVAIPRDILLIVSGPRRSVREAARSVTILRNKKSPARCRNPDLPYFASRCVRGKGLIPAWDFSGEAHMKAKLHCHLL
jgi:hypothetical protein